MSDHPDSFDPPAHQARKPAGSLSNDHALSDTPSHVYSPISSLKTPMLLQSFILTQRAINGTSKPHGVCNIVYPCTLHQLDDPVANQIPKEVEEHVNVPALLPAHWVFLHHDAGGVIHPHLCLTLLLKPQIWQQCSKIDHLHPAL
eukprot:1105174-Rhodomonas_salina.1